MSLKPYLAIALLFTAGTSFAADTPADLALADEVVELLGTKQAVDAGFKNSTNSILEQAAKLGDSDLLKSITAATDAFFAANFKWEKLKPAIVAAYAKQFTSEELQAIAAFYKTPAGQKLTASRPALNAVIDGAVNQQTKAELPALRNDLMRIVSEHMAKKGAAK